MNENWSTGPSIAHPVVTAVDAYHGETSRKLDKFLRNLIVPIIFAAFLSETEKLWRVASPDPYLLPGGQLVSNSPRWWIAMHMAGSAVVLLALLILWSVHGRTKGGTEEKIMVLSHILFGILLMSNVWNLGSLGAPDAVLANVSYYLLLSLLLYQDCVYGIGLGYYTLIFPMPVYLTLLARYTTQQHTDWRML